jgi:hypothetical protein
MEAQKVNRPVKTILLTILGGILIIPFTLRSKKHSFLISSIVPGAKGYVRVKKDDNKNYSIKVEVSDLAKVERVNPSKSTYVVWMETGKDISINLGQLKSSGSFLSKRLTASLETVSNTKPVKIFITTEDGTNLKHPGEQVVLTTERFSVK